MASEGEEDNEYDVVIVGAGVSGLSAAYELWKKEPALRLAVLEAKDRIGGRTEGREIKAASGTDTWDVGGQWVGRCQPHITTLLEELSLDTYPEHISGRKVMQLGSNKVCTYTGDIPSLPWYALIDLYIFMYKLEKMRRLVPREDPALCPHANDWDSITFEQAKKKMLWTKAASDALDAAGRCIFGVESSHISLLYYLAYASAAGGMEPLISATEKVGGQELKVKGGAWQVCHRLMDKIGKDKVHLSQPVTEIFQDDGQVQLRTLDGSRYRCSRAILSLPPHEAAKVVYRPSLPVEKLHVLQRMPVGYLTKVIVTYQTAFWRDAGYSGEAVTSGGASVVEGCDTGPLCIIFDATNSNGDAAIVAFIGGKQQLQYSKISASERQRAVLHSLSEFFGAAAKNCLSYTEKNWNEEPYNGGCPVSVGTPGVMTYIVPGLRTPFNMLHFAGTESATVWCGFLSGAVQAGYRAAHEVLYHLRPQVVTAGDLEGTAYDKSQHQVLRPRLTRRKAVRWTAAIGVAVILVVVARRACCSRIAS